MGAQGQTVGYIRVSSAGQNPARQKQTIGAVDTTFEDVASGKRGTERDGLAQLLAFVRRGDTVRVAHIDRLARSLVDLERLVGVLVEKGVTVEFVSNHLTFAPGGDDKYARFQRQVLAAAADLERAMIAERQAEGIALAKERGVYKGRRRKFTEAEAEQVRKRYLAGESVAALAKELGCSRRVIYDAANRSGGYARPVAEPPKMRGAETVALFEDDEVAEPSAAQRRRALRRAAAAAERSAGS
ncbi:helix-turn-helix domain-containing protein [Arsenicicoccus sp. MKL-02]|uniref:Helix-turn-helix domain-containing protein n=1 Tax=Arsenicicoccus cauae TaxID=2663847 RepID=A0A6I3J058_9MICO|nr:helix-turn-helix domain-containing protein [Arsenicicoccus cauae]